VASLEDEKRLSDVRLRAGALGIYAQVIASKTDHGAGLDGLVGAADWAEIGRIPAEVATEHPTPAGPETQKPPD
jgi:hypothetical protein